MIDVVSAVIIQGGRILLTQRRSDKDFPFTWECPGGKAEECESHHDALKRELREEIGVEVAWIPHTSLWGGEFKGDVMRETRRHIFLRMYLVGIDPGSEPSPKEGQGIGWFDESAMRALPLAPGNLAALELIAKQLRRSRDFGDVTP